MLSFPQVVIFRMLLKHILKEKIEYATSPISKKDFEIANKNVQVPIKTEDLVEDEKSNDLFVVEQVDAEKETSKAGLIYGINLYIYFFIFVLRKSYK